MERDKALQILSEHKAELAQKHGVKSIAIFGSTARNEAKPDSDVDILVDVNGAYSVHHAIEIGKALYWNQAGQGSTTPTLWRAVRMGKWKLVSPDYWTDYNPWRPGIEAKLENQGQPDPKTIWELYDMEADRTEVNDLADQYPDLVKEMADMYTAWERHCVPRMEKE